MKRTPMPPRTAPLERRTRLAAVNRKRKGSRFPHRRDAKYCAWIRTLPCLLAGESPFAGARLNCAGRVECAHVQSRGAGGDDRANAVPLCTRHHRQQHDAGISSFELFYGLNLHRHALDLVQHPNAPASPGSLQGAQE